MKRGEIRWFRFDRPDKRRPVLVLTRDALLDHLSEIVVVPVTTTIRGIPSEVKLGSDDGLPKECVLNAFHLRGVPRGHIGALITTLSPHRWPEVQRAVLFALGFEP